MAEQAWRIERVHTMLDLALQDAFAAELADVLMDCVEQGASVSFM
jgi:hypothetical protein